MPKEIGREVLKKQLVKLLTKHKGEYTKTQIAKKLNIARSSLYSLIDEVNADVQKENKRLEEQKQKKISRVEQQILEKQREEKAQELVQAEQEELRITVTSELEKTQLSTEVREHLIKQIQDYSDLIKINKFNVELYMYIANKYQIVMADDGCLDNVLEKDMLGYFRDLTKIYLARKYKPEDDLTKILLSRLEQRDKHVIEHASNEITGGFDLTAHQQKMLPKLQEVVFDYKDGNNLYDYDLWLKALDSIPKEFQDIWYKHVAPNFEVVVYCGRKYVLLTGGRGGAKTTHAVDFSILMSAMGHIHTNRMFVFLRKTFKKLDISLYPILKTRLKFHNVDKFFKIPKRETADAKIYNNLTGNFFVFSGISDIEGLKSLAEIGWVVCDEVEQFPYQFFDTFGETVREPGSRILMIENKYFEKSEAEKYVETYPSNSLKVQVNIIDLPSRFQNKQLLKNRDDDYKKDPEFAKHKWDNFPHPNRPLTPFKYANIVKHKTDYYWNPNNNRIYAFLDPSFKGTDCTAIAIAVYTGNSIEVIGFMWRNSWSMLLDTIEEVVRKFNVTNFSYESNGVGDAIELEFRRRGIQALGVTTRLNKVNKIFSMQRPNLFGKINFIDMDDSNNKLFLDSVINANEEDIKKNNIENPDDGVDALAMVLMDMGFLA